MAITDAATVLIQGKNGMRMEILARAISCLSRRSNMPLVALNCDGVREAK